MDRKRYLASLTIEDKKLIRLFTEEMDRINLLYMKAVRSEDMAKANELLKKLKNIAKTLGDEYGERADIRIPTEYIKWASYIDDVAGLSAWIGVGVALSKKEIKTIMHELGPVHIQAVNALLNNSKNYVRSSLDGMERQALTMINQLQQEKIREELAKGMISWEWLHKVNERVIEYFSNNWITGFKDRGGKFRSMDRYVDMLTRTETAIANTQGTINRAMELWITKFRIIEHADCCEACAEMNGDIVDITEWTVELPPFHPNCRGYIVADMSKAEDMILLGGAKREITEIRG